MLAVLIQGQVEAFNENSSSNIRTPFTKDVFEELLGISGWEKMKASSVDSPGLQDAQMGNLRVASLFSNPCH